MQGLGQLRFHRVLRDTKSLSDFPVRKVFKFTEDEDFPATRGQLRDRLREQVGLLMSAGHFGCSLCLIDDGRAHEFRYRNRLGRGPTPKKISRRIARRGKKKAARRGYPTEVSGTKDPKVGFLDQIIDIRRIDETMKVSPQGRLVRRELSREPRGIVGLG